MSGKLSVRRIHLGVLTADVQTLTEKERKRINKPLGKSSPGNWSYLIAHGRHVNQ